MESVATGCLPRARLGTRGGLRVPRSLGVRFMVDGTDLARASRLSSIRCRLGGLAAPLHRHITRRVQLRPGRKLLVPYVGEEEVTAGPGALIFKASRAIGQQTSECEDSPARHPRDHLAGRVSNSFFAKVVELGGMMNAEPSVRAKNSPRDTAWRQTFPSIPTHDREVRTEIPQGNPGLAG